MLPTAQVDRRISAGDPSFPVSNYFSLNLPLMSPPPLSFSHNAPLLSPQKLDNSCPVHFSTQGLWDPSDESAQYIDLATAEPVTDFLLKSVSESLIISIIT